MSGQELAAYLQDLQAAAQRQEAHTLELQSSIDALGGVRDLLGRLPAQVRHKVMVPYGRHAFFPGQLVHTNELMVSLGCDYQLEASALEAEAVLARRQAKAEAALGLAKAQLSELRGRTPALQAAMGNEQGDQYMEIRQDLEESEALLRSAAAMAAGAGAGPGPSRSAPAGGAAAAPVPAGPAGTGGRGRAGAPAEGQPHGNHGDDDDEDDERIFARLAELERLEAEAGPASDASGSGSEDGEAAAPLPAAAAAAAAARQKGAIPGRAQAAGSSGAGGGAGAGQGAATQRRAPAGQPLRKGFLLGSSSKAGTKQQPSGSASGSTEGSNGSRVGGEAVGSGSGLAAAASPPSSSAAVGELPLPAPADAAGGGQDERRARRVSFADGTCPGGDGTGAALSSPRPAPASSSPSAAPPPGILKSSPASQQAQPEQPGAGPGAAGGGGGGEEGVHADHRPAHGEAFTGAVLEHLGGGPAASADTSAALAKHVPGAAADEPAEAAPKRMSKFKQQRLGIL